MSQWIDNLRQAVFHHNPAGIVLYANHAAHEKLGFDAGQMRGIHVGDLVEAFTEEYYEYLIDKMRTHGHLRFEVVLSPKNSETIPAQLEAHRVETDAGEVFCCMVVPLAEDNHLIPLQERYEYLAQALSRRDDVMQAISEGAARYLEVNNVDASAPYLLGKVANAAGVCRAYVFFNRKIHPGQLAATQFLEWVGPESGLVETPQFTINYEGESLDRWPKVLGAGDILMARTRDLPDAEKEFFQSRHVKSAIFIPIFSERGWWGFMGFDDCLRERRWRSEKEALKIAAGLFGLAVDRQDAELRKQRHSAEITHHSRLSIMGEMASGMAHELNQPLTAISNFSEACLSLIDRDDQKPLLAETLSKTSHQAKRAAEIISRIRNFARKDETQTDHVQIESILRSALEYADLRITGQQTQIRVNFSAEPVMVNACVVQIEQVVLNLIINSLDALATDDAKENTLELSSEVVGDHVLVSVRDFGVGIAKDMVSVLYEPFESNKQEGLGMGLSISRTIVEAHQGKLWLDQSVEPGACFRFTLPISYESLGGNVGRK